MTKNRSCSSYREESYCTVTTAHEWVLPADLPSGLYTIVIGLYDPATGERAPVTSPVELTPPQVVLGHVLVVSAKPAAQPSLVTLRIFSGRRDPAWTLTSAQIAGLRERISALPVTDQAYDEAGRLGYTGFTVLLPAVDGHPAQRLAVWKGVVQLETERQVNLLADEGRSLERWLLETGVGRVEEHIIEAVRGELDVSSSTAP